MVRTKTVPTRNDGHGMESRSRLDAYARSRPTPERDDDDSPVSKRRRKDTVTSERDVQEDDLSSQIVSDTQTMQYLLLQISCITAHLTRLEDDANDDAWKEYCANGCNQRKSKKKEVRAHPPHTHPRRPAARHAPS